MEQSRPTERISNLELLQIMAMLMIIGHHYALYGVMQSYNPEITGAVYYAGSTINKLWANMLLPGGVVGVAVYFILAGFFGIEQDKVTIANIVQPVVFYGLSGLVVALVHSAVCGESIAAAAIFQSVFPIGGSLYWFATAYIILMIFKPYINSWVNRLSEKALLLVILMMCVEYAAMRYINAGYLGIMQGLFYYTIGAYIRRNVKRLSHGNPQLLSLFAVAFWLLYVFFNRIPSAVGNLTATVLLGTLIAGCMVLAGLSARSFVSERINRISKHTFGVYLFHEHILLRKLLWSEVLMVDSFQWSSRYFVLFSMLTIFEVFTAGILFDVLKQKYIDPHINRILRLFKGSLVKTA